MKKNYYEILEINRNASQEIVEKAYKTLAKKYHPDLQDGDKKAQYEEKLKIINEAYEVLSDPEKRKEYDATLPEEVSAEEYENLYRQKEYMKQRINRMEQQNDNIPGYEGFQDPQPENYNPQSGSQNTNENLYKRQSDLQRQQEDLLRRQQQFEYQQKINNAVNKAYHDAYVNELRRRGYRVRHKKTWRDYVAVFLTILVVIIAFVIAWHIPPVHNYFIKLYNENEAVRFIVNIFINFFNSFKGS